MSAGLFQAQANARARNIPGRHFEIFPARHIRRLHGPSIVGNPKVRKDTLVPKELGGHGRVRIEGKSIVPDFAEQTGKKKRQADPPSSGGSSYDPVRPNEFGHARNPIH